MICPAGSVPFRNPVLGVVTGFENGSCSGTSGVIPGCSQRRSPCHIRRRISSCDGLSDSLGDRSGATNAQQHVPPIDQRKQAPRFEPSVLSDGTSRPAAS